jgi:8-oxo-dGTP pyrophosphatase MutT (NUDIX family)
VGHRTATLVVDQPTDVIRAAGGLVVRRRPDGLVEVAVVHRPSQSDWSFPKGKLEEGETFEDAALREVREETGLKCTLGRFIGHTEYRDRKDRPKVVAYWVMASQGGRFHVNEEVDEIRWLPLSEAGALLSYERDRDLLTVLGTAEDVGSLI